MKHQTVIQRQSALVFLRELNVVELRVKVVLMIVFLEMILVHRNAKDWKYHLIFQMTVIKVVKGNQEKGKIDQRQ